MSSHVRTDTASAAYGTVMVTTTVATTAMSSVVSNLVLQILLCQCFKGGNAEYNLFSSGIP